MGLPSVIINFKETASSAIKRGERGNALLRHLLHNNPDFTDEQFRNRADDYMF